MFLLMSRNTKDTGFLPFWNPHRNFCTIKRYVHEFFGGQSPDRNLTFTNIQVPMAYKIEWKILP
ncbi:hypothetical protein TSAR_015707 [Trichomalopsis sarcophagae]|uniref:Uncharacterized protein n=1 Tax=Trichomalopsis sarcophagae TaxID=543379 RepID=A0A232EFZ9_9HYME|nr:hypothetical protein TSAR_015707 [Trichomalopsis sarcophagae]